MTLLLYLRLTYSLPSTPYSVSYKLYGSSYSLVSPST